MQRENFTQKCWNVMRGIGYSGWISSLLLFLPVGCSAPAPKATLPEDMPWYTQVPHPVGMNVADLSGIFADPDAPRDADFGRTCDRDFEKLKAAVQTPMELQVGTRELVVQDPVAYHWCFYKKLLNLEGEVKSELFIDVKQKILLKTFEFLTPVANAFNAQYHDSRYLRWAIERYRIWSESLFGRKLELTPKGTLAVVQPTNVFGLYQKTSEILTVLQKYRLEKDHRPPVTAQLNAPFRTLSSSSPAVVSLQPSPLPDSLPSSAPSPLPSESPLPSGTPVPESSPMADVSPIPTTNSSPIPEGVQAPSTLPLTTPVPITQTPPAPVASPPLSPSESSTTPAPVTASTPAMTPPPSSNLETSP